MNEELNHVRVCQGAVQRSSVLQVPLSLSSSAAVHLSLLFSVIFFTPLILLLPYQSANVYLFPHCLWSHSSLSLSLSRTALQEE